MSNSSLHGLASLGVVLVAAGRGERLGAGVPKAFTYLDGRTLIEHCVSTVCALPEPGHLVIVVPDSHAAETLELIDAVVDPGTPWQVSVVHGGRERHESVLFGLEALAPQVDTVLVHDAARPLTPSEVFERVREAVILTGEAVIPVLPVADTLKRVDAAGIVHETVDRAPLVSVQTPQGFPRELLAAAHQTLRRGADSADPHPELPTDDAEVVQRAGGTVRTVSGDTLAHKLTTPGDFMLLEALLARKTTDLESGAAE